MYGHSCAVYDNVIYACGNVDNGGKKCLGFSNQFYSGFQDMGTTDYVSHVEMENTCLTTILNEI